MTERVTCTSRRMGRPGKAQDTNRARCARAALSAATVKRQPERRNAGVAGARRMSLSGLRRWNRNGVCLRCLTFELTPTAEAGGVSPVRDDATPAADRAYGACRSGSGVERGVRHHRGRGTDLHAASIVHAVDSLPSGERNFINPVSF